MTNLLEAELKQTGSFQLGSARFDALIVYWHIDFKASGIFLETTLFGIKTGSVYLSRNAAEATLEGDVRIAKSNLTVTANFDKKELNCGVEVTSLYNGKMTAQRELFHW